MDWTKEWLNAVQNRNPIMLPPTSPTVLIFSEEGKRLSKCRVCSGVIPKGIPRMSVLMRTNRRFNYRNGGNGGHQKFHLHSECVTAMFGSSAAATPGHVYCFDCRTDMGLHVPGRDRYLYAASMNGHYSELCEECVLSGRYLKCVVCCSYHPKYRVSLVVDVSHGWNLGDTKVGSPCCDWCAESHEYVTLKQKKRREKADIRWEKKLDKVRAEAEVGYGEYTKAEDGREPLRQG